MQSTDQRRANIPLTLAIAAGVFTLLLVVTGGGVTLLDRSIERERVMRARQAEFKQLGDDLAAASDFLTEQARQYVQFGERKFHDAYWKEVNETKTRDRVVSRLKELGAPANELDLIEQAKRNSDALIATEDAAMKAVAANDLENARKLMFDEHYDANKAKIMAPIGQFIDTMNTRAAAEAEASQGTTRFYQRAILAVLAVAVVLTLAGSWLLLKRIKGVLAWIARELRGGLGQVASASTQMTGSSQQLAQGSTEQAASLEETSSALTQLAGAAGANADRANSAKALAVAARSTAETGSRDMSALVAAMSDVRASGTETAKIIKAIDEIAFQTNLLALNAAVEAARAGDAGKGFAVVAEEVRNLAMRSAEAARQTTSQIQASIEKGQAGSALCETVAAHFGKIVETSRQVDELVAEIARTSEEQSGGVRQVNTAITQMEKVTQQTAAGAEENAAAAEELDAQTRQMLALVDQLASDGQRQGDAPAPSRASRPIPMTAGPRVSGALTPSRMAAAVLLAVGSVAWLAPAASGAEAALFPPQDAQPMTDPVAAPLPAAEADSRLGGMFGVNFATSYVSRGIVLENEGLVAQPSLELGYRVADEAGPLSNLTLYGGVWSSVHSNTDTSGAAGNEQLEAWYEFDWYAGARANLTDELSLDLQYVQFISPSNAFNVSRNVQARVGYDDAELLGAWALRPYAAVLVETSGKAGTGGNEGVYAELGVAPGLTLNEAADTPVTLSFPVAIGLGFSDFYGAADGDEDTFGFARVGVVASAPVAALSTDRLSCRLSAGVHYWHAGDVVADANDAGTASGDHGHWQGTAGLNWSF